MSSKRSRSKQAEESSSQSTPTLESLSQQTFSQQTLDSMIVDPLDALVIPTRELYGAGKLEEIAELTSIDDEKLCEVVKMTIDGIYQFRHAGPGRFKSFGNKFLFKLSDVQLSGVVDGGSFKEKAFSFTSVRNVKLPFKISEIQQAKFDRWYKKMFAGLEYKPGELYANRDYKEAHSCRPYSVLKSGLPQMKMNVRHQCPIKINDAEARPIGETMQDAYNDYKGDVYVWISDMWLMDGTYGLKFEVVNIEVKNKLFN